MDGRTDGRISSKVYVRVVYVFPLDTFRDDQWDRWKFGVVLEVGTKIYIYVHCHSFKHTASYLIPQS